VNYCEWAATKKIKGDSPLFYTLIILALKKVKDGKKGPVPFYFLPKRKKCRHLIEIIQQTE
jgi:hypothetical protein